MKRILTAGLWSLAVAVFFTGCSSLAGTAEVDLSQIESQAEEEAATDESGENRLDMNEDKEKMPDYFKVNLTEKFKNLGGRRAFRIKEGHSEDTADIENFLISGLRADKTFIYGYTTKVKGEAETGAGGSREKLVHCGAFYNYDTESFHVFHENVFFRSGEETAEDEESFFMQVNETDGRVFVYDNGHGYVYDRDGTVKFHGSIEDFVRAQFTGVYSVSVVHAVTDWQNRIYLEVSIEKEKVETEEPAAGTDVLDAALNNQQTEDEGDDDADEEAEKKIESQILVYEYKPVNTGLDQNNEAFETQKNAWAAMTEGKEFTSPPSISGDWNKVKENHPDQWGDAFLGGLENKPSVYRWKEKALFSSVDGVTTLLPVPHTYIRFRQVEENRETENLFFMENDKYNGISGRTQQFRYYNPQTMERTYTYVWETKETDEEGNPTGTQKHSETHTQRMSNIFVSRYAQLTNGYVESYWTMDKKKAVSLGRCIGNEILCRGADEKVRWIQPGGSLKDTPYEVSDDREAGVFLERGTVYYTEYGRKSISIEEDRTHGGDGKDGHEILYENLAGGYAAGDSVYDKAFEEDMEKELDEGESVYGNDFFTEDQVVHASLDLDHGLALKLKEKGDQGLSRMAEGGNGTGYLLTSQGKGLIFYSVFSKESVVLETGTWFQTWNMGEHYVSVGFPKENNSYGTVDIVFAGVYEYSLSQLCNDSMRKMLEELEEEERRQFEAEESSRQAGEGEEETDEQETVQDPLDKWNEDYQKKHEKTLEEMRKMLEKLEEEKRKQSEAEESSRQAEAEESSRQAEEGEEETDEQETVQDPPE